MSLFRRRHHREDDERSDYQESLAMFQLRYGLDRHDLTLEQDRRRRECNPLLDAGLDPVRVAFARHLVEHGKVTP